MFTATKNVTMTMCGQPVRDRSKAAPYIGVIGGVIALIFFALRIVARIVIRHTKPGWDDIATVLGVVCTKFRQRLNLYPTYTN